MKKCGHFYEAGTKKQRSKREVTADPLFRGLQSMNCSMCTSRKCVQDGRPSPPLSFLLCAPPDKSLRTMRIYPWLFALSLLIALPNPSLKKKIWSKQLCFKVLFVLNLEGWGNKTTVITECSSQKRTVYATQHLHDKFENYWYITDLPYRMQPSRFLGERPKVSLLY